MTTKFTSLLCSFVLFCCFTYAQEDDKQAIEKAVQPKEVEMHVRFLASDELQGRDTGTPGLEAAARYIAEFFKKNNIKPIPNDTTYFQQVPFEKTTPPKSGTFTVDKNSYKFLDDFLVIGGGNIDLTAPIIYLNYGLPEDLKDVNVKDKIVVVKGGKPGETSPSAWFFSGVEKQKLLTEKGAKAVIELYSNRQLPWQLLTNYLSGSQLKIANDKDEKVKIPHIWLQDMDNTKLKLFAELKNAKGQLVVAGKNDAIVNSQNVIGIIEGTDPKLKNEYILLSAHYDHVGVEKGKIKEENAVKKDTIFNGARDNAVGAAAIMMAAKYFAANPPKRSIIFAAWTAEEKGLLGSAFYVEHPVIPMNKIVFNLNIDGAGYNDTTKVTVIGLERTDAMEDLQAASETFGLEAIGDPVPQQNLFDRSDNVNFAKKGIPAPTFSMGITAFDQEIMKYYHQVTDNPETLDYDYVTKYIQAFTLASQKIANASKAPFWKAGDKYENEGKTLYSMQ